MKYLVGENLFSLNSGTEFSQMQRLKAFKAAGIPAKIVLRNYNRFLGQVLSDNGLSYDDVIDMYDFFQETTQVLRKKQNLRLIDSIPLSDYHIDGVDNNHSLLKHSGKTIADIHVMPMTVGLIGDIQYLDDRGQKALGEYWDWRGFRSMIENYHPDGSVGTQRFLRADGTTAVEVTHMYINKQVLPTMYKLHDYLGRDYVFDTENQLFTFFLNELNAQKPGTFISDRRSVDEAVLGVVDPEQTIAVIHSLTFNNFKHPKAGILPAYQLALNQGPQQFDRVVFATKDQAADVAKVVDDSDNFTTAADCCTTNVGTTRKLGKELHLVYRGMLGTNKKIGDLIKAFHHVHQQHPQATLTLQGYFTSPQDEKEVKQLINRLRLDKAVKLRPYAVDDAIYDDATVFINASDNEAFGIAMLESMAHGVPVVAYAVPYLADHLVKDGVNGCLVTNKTPRQLARAINQLANDDQLYQQLSAGALATANELDQDHLVSSWQPVFSQDN